MFIQFFGEPGCCNGMFIIKIEQSAMLLPFIAVNQLI